MRPTGWHAVALVFVLGASPGAGVRGQDEPPIPEIPPDKLPPKTRPAPDPERVQYVLDPVFIQVGEKARMKEGEAFVPKVPVVERYLAEYFRRAGHPVIADASAAKVRIEGTIETMFDAELTVRERPIGWKYVGSAELAVRGADGELLESVEIPELFRVNSKSEKSAVWDLRRNLAHEIYVRLFWKGKVFANHEVIGLLEQLNADPFLAEEDVSGGAIVAALAEIGLPAVPYLIEALSDTRSVTVAADYPGLRAPSDLKVYHLADKALEEVFQKVSRMGIATSDPHRFLIIQGWEGEWRRFCKPFRESPATRPGRTEPGRPVGRRPAPVEGE